ncbi:MAG: energy transducer TonB, partial [Planctomycetota bacterium]
MSVVSGAIVATLLFLLMNGLIAGEPQIDLEPTPPEPLDFVMITNEEIVNKIIREKPPEPKPPKEPPPPVTDPETDSENQRPDLPDIETPVVNIGLDGDFYTGDPIANRSQEGDVVPVFLMQAQYPREAALDGTEGWVKLAFTIERDGSVSDVEVIDSYPRRVFDRAAVAAMYKSKF